MSNIIQLPRTAQPLHAERLDTSGICRGLVGAISGFNGFNHSINLVGGCSHVRSKYGVHFGGFNGTSVIYASVPTHKILTTAEMTVAFTLEYRSGSATRAYVSQGGFGSTGGGFKIASPSALNSLVLTLGGVNSYTIGTPFTDGGYYSVVVTVSGNGGRARAWVNGTYIGQSSVIGTMLTPAASTVIGASYDGSSYLDKMASGSSIGNVLILNKCLGGHEAQALSANPFLMFEPETIVYSSVAAGGGFKAAWAANSNKLISAGAAR